MPPKLTKLQQIDQYCIEAVVTLLFILLVTFGSSPWRVILIESILRIVRIVNSCRTGLIFGQSQSRVGNDCTKCSLIGGDMPKLGICVHSLLLCVCTLVFAKWLRFYLWISKRNRGCIRTDSFVSTNEHWTHIWHFEYSVEKFLKSNGSKQDVLSTENMALMHPPTYAPNKHCTLLFSTVGYMHRTCTLQSTVHTPYIHLTCTIQACTAI